MHTKLAAITIPIYKTQLSENEHISIQRCVEILGSEFDIIWIAPQSLNIEELENKYGIYNVERFDDIYFNSIASYNKLMLFANFYQRFLSYNYILIYQTDAYVFENKLEYWCNKGYDYIGAPWIKKKKYDKGYYYIYIYLRNILDKYLQTRNPYRLLNLVGNGGLSLRKVESHYNVCNSGSPILTKYISNAQKELYNEDIFWSIEANKICTNFLIPEYTEALKFSFDKSPEDAYHKNNNKLPFGCHGWSKKEMINFWTNKILLNNY